MKKSFTVVVVIPIIWGILITAFAVWCMFNFVVDAKEDSSQILWATCIVLGWLVAGLAPIMIGFLSWRAVNKGPKENTLPLDDTTEK